MYIKIADHYNIRIISGVFCIAECSRNEYFLVENLLHNYSTTVRPVQYYNNVINVSIDITLNQLIDLVRPISQ